MALFGRPTQAAATEGWRMTPHGRHSRRARRRAPRIGGVLALAARLLSACSSTPADPAAASREALTEAQTAAIKLATSDLEAIAGGHSGADGGAGEEWSVTDPPPSSCASPRSG